MTVETPEVAVAQPTTKKYKILRRWTEQVLFETEATSFGHAILIAIEKGANLAGANLAGAYLADANLADANLAGANLADANLADAYLAGAYLAGANLADANLAGANLAGAYLAGANLAGANLAGAYLAGAYLAGAKGLKGRVPADPPEPYVYKPNRSHQERAERFRKRHPDVPIVKDLDAKILAAIESGEGSLEMDQWHTCETTHCRAGWAIVLAGEEGRKLERKVGPHRAGMLIYGCSTGHVPYFFAKNEEALADIRACAARSQAAQNASATTTEPAQ